MYRSVRGQAYLSKVIVGVKQTLVYLSELTIAVKGGSLKPTQANPLHSFYFYFFCKIQFLLFEMARKLRFCNLLFLSFYFYFFLFESIKVSLKVPIKGPHLNKFFYYKSFLKEFSNVTACRIFNYLLSCITRTNL